MWLNVFRKCEIIPNFLLRIHWVGLLIIVIYAWKTWKLFQSQNIFMSPSRHDHFSRLSRSETRHWHSETATLKKVSRDIQLCCRVALIRRKDANTAKSKWFKFLLLKIQLWALSRLMSVSNLAAGVAYYRMVPYSCHSVTVSAGSQR